MEVDMDRVFRLLNMTKPPDYKHNYLTIPDNLYRPQESITLKLSYEKQPAPSGLKIPNSDYVLIRINSSSDLQLFDRHKLESAILTFSTILNEPFSLNEGESYVIDINSPILPAYTFEFLSWIIDSNRLGILNDCCLFLFIILGNYFDLTEIKWSELYSALMRVDLLESPQKLVALMTVYLTRKYVKFDVLCNFISNDMITYNRNPRNYTEFFLNWLAEENDNQEELERSHDFYLTKCLFELNPSLNRTSNGHKNKSFLEKYPIASSVLSLKHLYKLY